MVIQIKIQKGLPQENGTASVLNVEPARDVQWRSRIRLNVPTTK